LIGDVFVHSRTKANSTAIAFDSETLGYNARVNPERSMQEQFK